MTADELREAIHRRYATKAFDASRPIPANIWETLLDSLHHAPSSFGLQPWKFLVIEDAELRVRLREVSWNQAQVTEADKFLVLASRTDLTPEDTARWIARLAEVQGQDPADLAGYAKAIDGFSAALSAEQRQAWNTRQTYLALGQLMTSAAVLRIDSCPLEGIDPVAYDEILGLSESGYATSVGCALGYRSPDDASATRPKARFARDEVIEFR